MLSKALSPPMVGSTQPHAARLTVRVEPGRRILGSSTANPTAHVAQHLRLPVGSPPNRLPERSLADFRLGPRAQSQPPSPSRREHQRAPQRGTSTLDAGDDSRRGCQEGGQNNRQRWPTPAERLRVNGHRKCPTFGHRKCPTRRSANERREGRGSTRPSVAGSASGQPGTTRRPGTRR